MTKTTEQTKREMYARLSDLKNLVGAGIRPNDTLPMLESALEAHLEELRKDLNFACAHIDLDAARMAKLVQERDDIQTRLHAIDHAYHVQSQANAAAGDELRHSNEVIEKQRMAIEALQGIIEARKSEGATLAQDLAGNYPQVPRASIKPVSFGDSVRCCRVPLLYRDGCGVLQCRSCGA